MNIIIVGCGKIGRAIVANLVNEGHDITVIDNSPDVIREITNIYDVMGLCGNGADCETLEEAYIDKADLLIATTHSDEFNMLSCFLAKKWVQSTPLQESETLNTTTVLWALCVSSSIFQCQ